MQNNMNDGNELFDQALYTRLSNYWLPSLSILAKLMPSVIARTHGETFVYTPLVDTVDSDEGCWERWKIS